jgi:hypothetical protein
MRQRPLRRGANILHAGSSKRRGKNNAADLTNT